ncbi:Competence protein ComM [Anaerolineae bacterium]|nr:Competence protein ComM [Anaerolineae bacterium]
MHDKFTDSRRGEPSSVIQAQVEAVRERQYAHHHDLPSVLTNSDLGAGEIGKFCKMDESAETLLKSALRKLQLSARAYHRVLKVNRTMSG